MGGNFWFDPSHPSGVALITVDEAGENAIVVASGANMALEEVEILRSQTAIAQAKLILLQLEIPLATVELAAQLAFNRTYAKLNYKHYL